MFLLPCLSTRIIIRATFSVIAEGFINIFQGS